MDARYLRLGPIEFLNRRWRASIVFAASHAAASRSCPERHLRGDAIEPPSRANFGEFEGGPWNVARSKNRPSPTPAPRQRSRQKPETFLPAVNRANRPALSR